MPTTILLPDSLYDALVTRVGDEGLAAWGIEAMAVEAVRQGTISRRKAASILEIDSPDVREAFFERHGLSLEYTLEDMEEDFRTLGLRR